MKMSIQIQLNFTAERKPNVKSKPGALYQKRWRQSLDFATSYANLKMSAKLTEQNEQRNRSI